MAEYTPKSLGIESPHQQKVRTERCTRRGRGQRAFDQDGGICWLSPVALASASYRPPQAI